jgi:RHS repeat-associated protein
VSTSNGAVSISIPIGQRFSSGGAMGHQLTLFYSSSVWSYSLQEILVIACASGDPLCTTNTSLAGEATVNPDFNAGVGWQLALGKLYAPNSPPANPGSAYVYADAAGGRHKFFDEIRKDAPSDNNGNFFYTRDGSYLRLRKAHSGLPNRIEFPDGTIHEFDSSGRVVLMKDRFGNQTTVSYSSNGEFWYLSDGIRTQTVRFINYGSQYGGRVVDWIDVVAFDGTPARYSFYYQASDIRRTCLDTYTLNNQGNEEQMVPVLFLARIEGPEGVVWSMEGPSGVKYHKGAKRNNAECSYSGVVERMKYPTGGQIDWTWRKYSFPTTGFPWVDQAPGVSTRTQSSPFEADATGTWTFVPDLKTDELWTDVTDPVGNKTRYFSFIPLPNQPGKLDFDYGLPISKKPGNEVDGKYLSQEYRNASNQLLRRVWLRFERDPTSPSWIGADRILTNRMVAESRLEFVDDGGRWVETELTDHDGLGHYRNAVVTDSWSSTFARTTHTAWNPTRGCLRECPAGSSPSSPPMPGEPWILGTYGFGRQIENGVVSKQLATFDSATGALLETRVLRDFGYQGADPAPSNHDLVTRICRDGLGNLSSVRLYGGDTQDLSLATIGCGAVDSSVYRTQYETQYGVPKRAYMTDTSGNSIGFDLFTATIEPNTGRAVESCDANGLCQQFSYDDLGRLTQVKDSPSVGPSYKGATVQYSYAYVEAANGGWTTTTDYLCPVGGSTPCDPAEFPQSQTVISGFGRPHLSRVRHADGSWSKQASLFDAVGNVLKTTTWVPDSMSVASAPGTIFSGHDAFGRPSTITLPDGKVQSQTFVGVRQRTRTAPVAMDITGLESNSSTIETYDRNGRLVRVDEPSMAGGGLTNATYEYNVLGKLTKILHSAGANLQTRTWAYDARGLLISESAPERVDAVVMGAYDAAGQAGSRTVNDQTLLFAFDRAGRPLTVSRQLVGGGSELLQRFTYDTGMGLGLGRLASAESWTRYAAALIGDVHTTEEYEYAGLRGNASAKITTVAIDGVTTASTTQTYGWSPMGAIRELGYPSGMTIDDPARVVSHEYDSGFLTAIPGFANSLTYHDNLALASVGHSNGVTDWVGQDPDRMMRPAALWTSGVAGEENWNSGSYEFDGSGNIKAIGAQRFRYDAVSRLVEAKIWVPENNPPLNSFDDGFETGDTCNWEVRNAASGCVAGAHQLGLETYTYDPYGNLIARTTETTGGATEINTPADPQTNRLQGASTYDDEGNMTGWNLAQYDFNALGQMVRMHNGNEDWLFAYSTGGERVLQIAEGGLGEMRWTVRDVAGRVLREWVAPAQGEPSWTHDWIYRGGQILATVERQPEELLDQAEGETSQVVQGAPLSGPVEVILHLTLDHLGTPRLVTNEAGTNLAFHIYWPYGQEASDPLQDELRMKFTGHERDSYDLSSLADDLDYMRARFANPIVGRFQRVDPLSGWLGAPQTSNRYAYALGNPIIFSDATGLDPLCDQFEGCYDDPSYDLFSPFWCSLWGACSGEYPRADPESRFPPDHPRVPPVPDGNGGPTPNPPGEPFNDPRVKLYLACLGESARWGNIPPEKGGVEWYGDGVWDPTEGEWDFRPPAPSDSYWGGPAKKSAGARWTAHTHGWVVPTDDGPSAPDITRQDLTDEKTGLGHGVPLYIVKKNGVWRREPFGGTVQLAKTGWANGLRDPCASLGLGGR